MKYPFVRPKFYLRLIKDLARFIAQPQYASLQNLTVKNKIYDTLGLFLIKLAFSLLVANVLAIFYEPKNITETNMAERFTPLAYLMVGGLILPLYEEVCFRLSLRFKPLYVALTFATLTYYILTKAIYKTNLSLVDETFYSRIGLSIGFGVIAFILIYRKKIHQKLTVLWENNIRWIYYLSCVLFAWLHIFNFELNLTNILLLPILTLPQLFSATIAGYTRLSFGFRYPLFVHMGTNLLFISLSFLPLD
ncbi:hypothetical protein [Arenibacter algicola]|uniref:CAAX protease family protein n=1 Tax=Arenibacter algicola TaxID=616991 RepID=A0A221UWC3_9FLAO|nr:hypothetical protein [Arenibacter algicola]ASO05645.1 CAAX protease family protein [Arenibacter algicola]|tara:strand:- start:77889 stop:78635 length:747 start_codon:yes stop_codon:yes gene_type:complete